MQNGYTWVNGELLAVQFQKILGKMREHRNVNSPIDIEHKEILAHLF